MNAGIQGRRTPRRGFNRQVGIIRQGDYALFRAVQISEGGMLVFLPEFFAQSDLILITVILPGGRGHVIVKAELLYRAGQKNEEGLTAIGMKFVDIGMAQRRQIRDYVSAKTKAEADNDVLADNEFEAA